MSLWQKKRAKAYTQARLRKRDGDGNIIIDMTVSNDDDFLSVYSASHTPVISTDVAVFMANSAHSISRHTVKLKKWIENFENPYPICIDAVGEVPLEDCGGRYGFEEKLEILADPKRPYYQEIMDWTGGKCTKSLDMKRINCRIADADRRCISVIYS